MMDRSAIIDQLNGQHDIRYAGVTAGEQFDSIRVDIYVDTTGDVLAAAKTIEEMYEGLTLKRLHVDAHWLLRLFSRDRAVAIYHTDMGSGGDN